MQNKTIPLLVGVSTLATAAFFLWKYNSKRKCEQEKSSDTESTSKSDKRKGIGGITRVRDKSSFDTDVISSWNEDIEQADNDLEVDEPSNEPDGIDTVDLDSSDFGGSLYDNIESMALDAEGDGLPPISESDTSVEDDSMSADNLAAQRLAKAIKQAKEVVEARKEGSVLNSEVVTFTASETSDVIDSLNKLSDTAELELSKIYAEMARGASETGYSTPIQPVNLDTVLGSDEETEEEVTSESGVSYVSDTSNSDLLSTAEFEKITAEDILSNIP